MQNQEIAKTFYEIADFLEIKEVEYKPRAYRTAAENIESLSTDIEDIHDRNELEEIEGIGESIAEKVAEYLDTGYLAYYEDLKADLPIDIEAITSVKGVGPKTAKKLYLELDVLTLEDLEHAAENGAIAELEGFGKASQQNILDRIEWAKRSQERMLLGRAFPIARSIETRLQNSDAFDRVDIVGSFRRRRPTVGDLDILATASAPEVAMEEFCTHDNVKEVLARGNTKSSVIVSGGLQIDLRIVDDSEYGAALIYFTGSKDHNITLRNRAIDHGWKLNEYGLFDVSDVDDVRGGQRVGKRIASETEPDIYDTLNTTWIQPELREDTGEVDAAAASELPDLVERSDMKGDLHLHTKYSNGSHSVREIAVAADELGMEYILITDYGPHVPTPHTLDAETFDSQQTEIKEVNDDADIAVTVLQGIEAEITDEGLEIPEDWHEACDLVVAGIHSQPSNPTEQVRIAFHEFPIDVFAHPTNRLINEHGSLDLDLNVVMETASDEHIAVEINARPERLDLDWQFIKEYRETVHYVVSTDSHMTDELDNMQLGVSQARRGWCETDNVLNTRSLDDLMAFYGK
ncbi:helix-hairpin-helix domain-containing protein [Halococcus thailandensis]|uniref:DNA polymerase beta n=1 Tax=Halococcus thailandensis JCM 13552 TaxID=1227457 RepID=M0NHJ8_9EURY|nr:helix-hairpin-helix domain-containing protein [Halococcus thailandensis]EMA56125.1 DNA polymerase (family X) [Halococcus thailandensis JCM 13552]